jgi:uncharacterized protein YlxW (UPF0749 family)
MRRSAAQWSVAFVCLLLGLGIVMQLRTYHTVAKAGLAPADQALVIGSLVDNNAALRREVADLETKLDAYNQPGTASSLDAMMKDLDELRIATGSSTVTGPGVEILVNGGIRPEEAGDLLNELRNAGAEAVAVNGQRLGARSVFQVNGNGYRVGASEISVPLRFTAIGSPTTMETALLRKGGVVSLLRSYYTSMTIDVTRKDTLTLPPMDPAGGGYVLARAAQ